MGTLCDAWSNRFEGNASPSATNCSPIRAISVPDMDGVPPEVSEMSVGRKGNITDTFSYRRLLFFFFCDTASVPLLVPIWKTQFGWTILNYRTVFFLHDPYLKFPALDSKTGAHQFLTEVGVLISQEISTLACQEINTIVKKENEIWRKIERNLNAM